MIRIPTNRRGLVWSLTAYGGLLSGLVGSVLFAEESPAIATAMVTTSGPASDLRTADPGAADPGAAVFGDLPLRGQIDLSRMTLRGDELEVPLPDGRAAVLTLDPALQARAEAALAEADAPYGAIVVMDTEGRLLALAGRSTAEPSLGIEALALTPWAPAASVFKVVTSAALVDAGVAPEETVCFHGGRRSVERSNLADSKRDRACESFTRALARSQNAVIAKLAVRHLDPPTLRRAADSFGFGEAPAFALRAESGAADIPETPLEFARVAAGFWKTDLSALGGALLAGTVATGGLRLTPRIVEAVRDADGAERELASVAPRRVLAAATAAKVGAMMGQTTEMGTAWTAFHDRRGRRHLGDVVVAGKTGSLSRRQPSELNYSWFVGFAPLERPEIVVSVVLGNGPRWRLKSHALARMVLEAALAD